MITEVLKIVEEFWWLGLFSIATFSLTILILPLVIIRLPKDYFVREKPDRFIIRQNKRFRYFLQLVKNMAGILLLLMGILMLFMPGQGVLTIIAALSIMNFPGRRKLEIKLVSNKKILKSLNWIRKKGKKTPFLSP